MKLFAPRKSKNAYKLNINENLGGHSQEQVCTACACPSFCWIEIKEENGTVNYKI